MFLLDTDHIVFLQRSKGAEYSRLISKMAGYPMTDFHFPIISFHEQYLGWSAYINRSKTSGDLVRGYLMMHHILQDFVIWKVASFDDAAALQFQALRAQRIRIGTMDLRIAAIALVHGYTVLSRNLVDFQQVPGLSVEDWTKP